MPATRGFSGSSSELVACITAFLAQFFIANDGRIASVFEDQYTSTLETLNGTNDEAFKVCLTPKPGKTR